MGDQLIRSATQFSGQLESGQRQDRTSAGNWSDSQLVS